MYTQLNNLGLIQTDDTAVTERWTYFQIIPLPIRNINRFVRNGIIVISLLQTVEISKQTMNMLFNYSELLL